MLVLGVADGPSAAAALVDGDGVRAACRASGDLGLPWAAVERVLREARVLPGEVEGVAVAGRYRHLAARRGLGAGLAPVAGLAAQALLRATGLGAVEADRTGVEWERELAGRGVRPHRVTVVEAHAALAEAAYRQSELDDLVVLVVEPVADGVAASVYVGRHGQVDRVARRGPTSPWHLVEQRISRRIALPAAVSWRPVWAEAVSAEAPEPDLVAALVARMGREDSLPPFGPFGGPGISAWEAVAAAPDGVALASFRRAVEEVLVAWARPHAEGRALALAGRWFADPRVAGAVAAEAGADRVLVGPAAGPVGAALGAALRSVGAAPRPEAAFDPAPLVAGWSATGGARVHRVGRTVRLETARGQEGSPLLRADEIPMWAARVGGAGRYGEIAVPVSEALAGRVRVAPTADGRRAAWWGPEVDALLDGVGERLVAVEVDGD